MTTTGKQPSTLKIYFRLLAWVRPYLLQFGISVFGFLIFASAQPMMGGAIKVFVDAISADKSKDTETYLRWFAHVGLNGQDVVLAVPFLIILIILWQGLGGYLGNYFLARVSLGLVHDLRVALFDRLLKLPNTWFDRSNTGHLISRIIYDTTMVTGAATDAIKIIIREGLTVIFFFGALLWLDWQLTMVMVLILPVIGLVVRKASHKFQKYARKIRTAMGDITQVVSEVIQGYRIVRSFGGEQRESKRFFDASQDNTQRQLRMAHTNSIYTQVLQLITFTAMSVVLFLVLYLRQGDRSPGDLVAFITMAAMLPKPIRQLSETSSTIHKGVVGAESIFGQIDEPTEPDNGTVEMEKVRGHVVVKNLVFSYPGFTEKVLDGINFEIKPGQMVALVGRSGSGKSTLVNLIPRLYEHTQGEILIDDVEVGDFKLLNLRHHIASVSQTVMLFNGTVANNIAYGELADASLDEIKRAAESANAREFIDQLPDGFNTEIGENGITLSGGQRQRMAIARALLKDAPILILDEATSALDTESERHIQNAIAHAIHGRSTLVIAHRLSTIERADLILVMENGRIIERGTHAQLLAHSGHYARLHAMQFSDIPEEDAG